METINNPAVVTPSEVPLVIQKKSNVGQGVLLVLGSILLLAGGALGYKLYEDNFSSSKECTTEKECTSNTTEKPETTYTVNTMSSNSNYSQYLIFQIKYSSKFLVTSDDMLTSYKSQGGSADPRLVLSTIAQPLGSVSYDKLLSQNDGSTIAIWSTIGYDNLEEWLDQPGITAPVTVSEEEIVSGDYVFEKRIITSNSKAQNFIVAYLSLPNDISYFFETNNTNAENDFDSILKSFDVRGDVE